MEGESKEVSPPLGNDGKEIGCPRIFHRKYCGIPERLRTDPDGQLQALRRFMRSEGNVAPGCTSSLRLPITSPVS